MLQVYFGVGKAGDDGRHRWTFNAHQEPAAGQWPPRPNDLVA